jgi:hypothetical protein
LTLKRSDRYMTTKPCNLPRPFVSTGVWVGNALARSDNRSHSFHQPEASIQQRTCRQITSAVE